MKSKSFARVVFGPAFAAGIGLVALVILAAAAGTYAGPASRPSAAEPNTPEPIVWYGMMPHPYTSAVLEAVTAFEKDTKVRVLKVVGQEWTQDNENNNIEALADKGHKAFCLYPGDPAGANGLFKQLADGGQIVICYGAEPKLPTPASFTVATDIKAAAGLATEHLIKTMGGKGNILNVLETVTDINTIKRKQGIEEVVKKHPKVRIITTIGDVVLVSRAKQKIAAALAAEGNQVGGIITTGYSPTVAAAAVLTQWNKNHPNHRIHFIGLDTAPSVLKAIGNGSIDATIAQNVFAQGYVSVAAAKLMINGWKPAKKYQFIDTGAVVVTKANVKTYTRQLRERKDELVSDLMTKYLKPPAKTVP